jgi:predicted RNase H-like HicB family nuclease
MSKKHSYPVQIFWSDEDNGYVAVVPDLPGCSAFGDTAEEALRESEDAIGAWLQAAKAAGNAIPSPSQLPLQKKHSGKVLLRMPQSLHGKLCRAAEEEGVSLNQYMVYLLADGVSSSGKHGSSDRYYCNPFLFQGPSGVIQAEALGGAVFSTTYLGGAIGANLRRVFTYPNNSESEPEDPAPGLDWSVPIHPGAIMRSA